MFLAVTKVVTTACVLLHAVVGCGWHHVHGDACTAHAGCLRSIDPGQGELSDHGHRHESGLQTAGEAADCDHRSDIPCDHERCTYVRAAAPVVQNVCGAPPSALLPSLNALTPVHAVVATLHIKPPPRTAAVKLALLQVLLV